MFTRRLHSAKQVLTSLAEGVFLNSGAARTRPTRSKSQKRNGLLGRSGALRLGRFILRFGVVSGPVVWNGAVVVGRWPCAWSCCRFLSVHPADLATLMSEPPASAGGPSRLPACLRRRF